MSQLQTVRQTLLSIVQPSHHIFLHADVSFRLRLLDTCPDAEREIDLLMAAFNSDTVNEMQRLRHGMPTEILLPKLTRWLMRDAGIEEKEASWSVNSWAMALGLLPFADESLTPVEEINKPAIQPDKIRLEGHTNYVTSVSFNAQGTHLASSSWDGTVRLWDMRNLPHHRILTPQSQSAEPARKERMLNAVAFDADGGLVAAADNDGSIWLWNTHDGAAAAVLTGHLRSVNRITFSRDKYLLASCSRDYTVCLWDIEQGKQPIWSREFDYMAECIVISPDCKLAALATKGVDILLLDITAGATVRELQGHSVTVRGVAFTPDGSTLVSVSGDGTIRLWDVESGKQTRLLCLNKPATQPDDEEEAVFNPSCVTVSPDGQYIAVGDFDERIYLWRVNAPESTPFMQLHGHAGTVSSVAFSPDGKWLASSSLDKTICLWDMLTAPLFGRHQ